MAAKKHAKKPATKHAKKPAAKKPAAKKPAAKKPAAKKPAAKKPAAKRAAAPRKAKTPHPVVHWEIQSLAPGKLFDFYANAFGWEIDANNPMNYGMVASGAGADSINGGIGGTQHTSSRVVVYASVPDIVDALGRIEEHGGKTMMPRTDIGPIVRALFEDPEGNVFGLVEE